MSYDYNGDMRYFQAQVAAKGIPVKELDMNDYAGLTKEELQQIVDNVNLFRRKRKETKEETYRTYKTAIERFIPELTKYGFALHLTSFGFLNVLPAGYTIEDTASREKYWFNVYDGENKTPVENFLSGLTTILRYRKPEPAVYNRLKGLYYTILDTITE